MTKRRTAGWWLTAAVIGVLMTTPAAARDAAFMQPSGGNGGNGEEAVKVEPKGDIDIGETELRIARRATIFFVNESNLTVQVEKVALNSDANVTAEITSDDCSKQGSIAPLSRCSVEVSVTPSSPGSWTVEALLTHTGPGRIARAKLSGKTSGSTAPDDKKETGLSLSSKEVSPVNFGDVEVGGKAVRSALMVNDSTDPITIFSIDVIEAENGLQLLDEGCSVDMELKPGETCPVTLLWAPTNDGQISTDLIIRHSGRQGFAVVPVRGKTKGEPTEEESDKNSGKNETKVIGSKNPAPPTPGEIDKAAGGKIPPVPADELGPQTPPPADAAKELRLIGTVGNQALLLLPDRSTKIVTTGDDVDVGNDQKIKVTAVTAKSIDLLIDGKKKELRLGSSPELVAKATAAEKVKAEITKSAAKSGATPTSSISGSALSSTTTAVIPLPTGSSGGIPGRTGTWP